MMRKVLFWLILLTIPAALAGQFFVSRLYKTVIIEPADRSTIKIILVGDIMLDRGVQYMIEKQGDGDFKFPFLKIAEELNGADIVFGNLEGPISDKGTKVGSIYSFRNDPEAIEGLTFAGFNVISLANNHAFDYGREALEDTLERLKSAGIDYVGFGPAAIKNIRGTKIAFLAYTAFGPAKISESDFEKVRQEIKTAEEETDILIVSLHAGEEYQKTPDQLQVDFFKIAYEAGADLVVGHHPHVTQPDFYSLGNFVFDQGFSEETMKSEIIEVQIQGKKIKKILTKKIKINEFFQPVHDLPTDIWGIRFPSKCGGNRIPNLVDFENQTLLDKKLFVMMEK